MDLPDLLRRLGLDDLPAEVLVNDADTGPTLALEVPQESSFDRWSGARERGAHVGWIPVAVGSTEELDFLRETLETARPAKVIDLAAATRRAEELDVEAWLRERAADKELLLPRSDWPDDAEPSTGFYFPFDDDGEPLAAWWMLLVPAEYDWQVPLCLGWGGWNHCPPPEVHAAFLRRWAHRLDAELVAITSDSMELTINRPPTERAEAIDLATELYIYCPDVVEQGYGSIESMAASMVDGASWFLWWD